MKPGTILFTKNGSHTGNAILIRELTPDDLENLKLPVSDYLKKTGQSLFEVETDFGNICRFSSNELSELYTPGPQRDYEEWLSDRKELRRKDHA